MEPEEIWKDIEGYEGLYQVNEINTEIYSIEEYIAKDDTDKSLLQIFIYNTLKKFERSSPWFKRYMCGKRNTK